MVEMQMENERVERLRLQKLGEDWIQAISDGGLDRLAQFCDPAISSRLLLPRRFITLDSAPALVAKYREWFDDCTELHLEASRVARVGGRLGVFYRFLLRKDGDWHRIEQQLYCTLKNGRVEQLHLVCSGFQLVGMDEQSAPADAPEAPEKDPVRDAVLEFYAQAPDAGSTCALLTPMMKAKLREMQSGQVLEVRVDDPTAKGDIEAWSRLSGNTLLKMVDNEGPILRFFVEKK